MRSPPDERPRLKLKLSPQVEERVKAALPPKPVKPDKDGPERKCVLTGQKADRVALIRLVLSPEGEVLPDVRAKAPGRGAWLGVDRASLQRALDSGKLKSSLFRAFRRRDLTVPADLPEQIETQLARAALDRLGLEARASMVVTGSERIETAARSGKLLMLLHAADASEDGSRKLDQAWRVGQGAEGTPLKGLAIPAPRTTLSAALGRENIVHVGVTDGGAAKRLDEALTRWRRFIGSGSGEGPCETRAQGSIADAAPASTTADSAAPAGNEGLTTLHE